MKLAGGTFAELEDAIIQVLLRNARENGRRAYMRGFEIGKEIGTYRRHAPSPGDRFGRAHRKLLDKLQDEGRAEPRWSGSGKVRTGWRLTEFGLKKAKRLISRSDVVKAKRLISRSDVVIVITGQDAYNALDVEKEVTIANQQGTPRPKNSTGSAIRGAGDKIRWKWKQINAKISECLKR